MELHFCDQGVGAKVYEKDMLETSEYDAVQRQVFQQDSTPTHKACSIQEWLQNSVPSFNSVEDWPSGNLDLNPLDFKSWADLEGMVCTKPHCKLESEGSEGDSLRGCMCRYCLVVELSQGIHPRQRGPF